MCTTQTDMGDCRVNELHKFKEVKLTVCPFLAVCPWPLLRSSTTVPPGSFLFVVCHFQQNIAEFISCSQVRKLAHKHNRTEYMNIFKEPPHL